MLLKAETPDKFRVSAFSLSLLFRHFPDSKQKGLMNESNYQLQNSAESHSLDGISYHIE